MAAGLGSRREARGQFLLGQVFPLTYLILLFLPKMPDISKQAIQTAGTGNTPAYMPAHLAASGDRVLQCTAPSSPIKHSVSAQEGLAQCHTAQEPCPDSQGTRQPRWGSEPRMELWVAREAVGGYPQSHWPAPQLIKLPIKDNRYCTLEEKDLFQTVSHLFSSLEPMEAAHILLDLRPLHPFPAYICQTAVLGVWDSSSLQPLSSTLVQNHSILQSTWINNIASPLGMCRVFFL